mmetsp:Transcript_16860/g.25955  ORF Transcript_16860/g.25955 Transcript_16860/m.25955 type:complete len:81 (-) Transcript_16860:533-775(-)
MKKQSGRQFQTTHTPEELEVLKEDLKLLEKMRKQYSEMLRINEDKIVKIEEDFIDFSVAKHGHIFNAWKEIKQGRFGVSN